MDKKKVKRYFEADESKGDQAKPVKSNNKHEKLHKKRSRNKDVNMFNDDNKGDLIEVTADLKQKRRIKKTQFKKKDEPKKFPGKLPIPKEKLEKHSRGEGLEGRGVKNKHFLNKLKRKENHINYAVKQAARTEILLPEDIGYMEADDGETTTQFTQRQIAASVDIAAASKHFELHLKQFGPYRMRYSRNGRHLILGGKMGHVAAFDWVTKHLHCELNVMESVHDVCWMHIETLYAVAQKDWVYMYDNKGTEIHCLKKLNKVLRMEFLPYHFLLATGSELGYLSWLDISIGEMVKQQHTKCGKISIMKQNPYNGVVCVGESKGIVTMWSPMERAPLASMLCHKSPLTSLAIDPKGIYMATSAVDRTFKVWDIRKLEGPLQSYYVNSAASQLEFSSNNLLAVGMGNVVEVYRDCCKQQASRPYLRHRTNAYVENMSFCPYEDVLGVSTSHGFVSLIVPGSGEANFDALESNPYQSKSQRREAEVKALLEKIQPELICLDPGVIAEVDVPSLKDKVDAHNKLMQLKPKKVNYVSRKKNKNKSTARVAKNKKIVQELENKEFVKKIKEIRPKITGEPKLTKSFGVLDRFVKK